MVIGNGTFEQKYVYTLYNKKLLNGTYFNEANSARRL